MTGEEEDALHLFCLRLSHKLLAMIPAQSQTAGLWQEFYRAIRTDLERSREARIR